jgi:hypothetical protein
MGCTGAEPSVLVRKRWNDQGAKGLRHLGEIMGNVEADPTNQRYMI